MSEITGIVITVYDKNDGKPGLSEDELLELKEFLESVDLGKAFQSVMSSKPKVLHNYRYIKDGVVEHWITEIK